jgi:sporulation protein YlmC with PRC-barrel domain
MKTERLANLIGRRVIDAEGQKIGDVVDVVLDREDDFRIVAIEVGTTGWVHRLNIAGTIQRRRDLQGVPQIRWSEIASIEKNRITLTKGAEITPPASHK